MSQILYVGNVIHFVVKNRQVIKLSDYVRRILRDKKLSYRDVANASGGLINHSTVGYVINENHKITVTALQGLAKGLGESEDLIFDLARGKAINHDRIANDRFARIAESYVQMPEQIQKTLEPLISAIEATIDSQPEIEKTKKIEPLRKELTVVDETVFQDKK